jgi:hypothetical protein
MHGFVLSKGQFQSIDDPFGMGTTTVNGTNERGDLVGFYVDAAGNTDGFLAIPKDSGGPLTHAELSRPANADNILASAAAMALNPDLVDALFATTPDQTGHHNGHHGGK